LPRRITPKIEKMEPRLAKDLSDTDEPIFITSSTESCAPSRAKLRSDSALPIMVTSKIDMDDANRDIPVRENIEPRRA
jgi:hypothetical protein